MNEQLSLFDNERELTPLASRLRPESLGDFAGQEHLLGPGRLLRQLILGTSGRRQDDAGPHHRQEDKSGFYRFQRCHKRNQRNQRSNVQSREGQACRHPHARLCGRDPPFQQSPAGRLPAICGKGKHHPHRSHDGKSFV